MYVYFMENFFQELSISGVLGFIQSKILKIPCPIIKVLPKALTEPEPNIFENLGIRAVL